MENHHLKLFGRLSYNDIPKQKRLKLFFWIFVGNAENTNGYKLHNEKWKVFINKNVKFNEYEFSRKSLKTEINEAVVDDEHHIAIENILLLRKNQKDSNISKNMFLSWRKLFMDWNKLVLSGT